MRVHARFVVVGVLSVRVGYACTCAPPPPPAQGQPPRVMTVRDVVEREISQAQAIFEGLVERQEVQPGSLGTPDAVSLTPFGAHRVVTIRSLRVYRGEKDRKLTVLTGMGGGDCGFDFEVGNRYLVYASRLEKGQLFTNICSGTSLVDRAGAALRVLRGEPATADDVLDYQTYYQRMISQWTGSVCGRVSASDGKPLAGANVDLQQVRHDPFPPNKDGDLTKSDGSFCITIWPGRYLLTAEKDDWDAGSRVMGYYPGVVKHSEALPIEVQGGGRLSNLGFGVRSERIYTVRFKVLTSDESRVPSEYLRVRIDSRDEDALAYHEDQGVEDNGTCELGGIPAGHYVVTTFFEPGNDPEKAATEASKWVPAKIEVNITGNQEVSLTLARAPTE